MNRKKKVLFTGSNGFPFGSAVIQRQIQLANSLLDAGYEVVVLNNRGTHTKATVQRENIVAFGKFKDVKYIYTSILPYKSKNFIIRNSFKFIGKLLEFFIICYYVLFKEVTCIFNNSVTIKKLSYYHRIAKFFKVQLIYDYVEMVSSIKNRGQKELDEIENNFDTQFYNHVDKLIVISSFLNDYVELKAPSISKIKIPPIIDFTYFDQIDEQLETQPFFLFCGSAAYIDVIQFILRSYHNSKASNNGYNLKLVLNGKKDEMDEVYQFIEKNKLKKGIEIISNLSYSDLVSFYKAASALLIPIKNNLQDQARFPFKICEYVASKRPIITSNAGVINEFFTNNENAFISKIDDIEDFTDKINLVADNPELARKVGAAGYLLGKEVFNYKAYAIHLSKLIEGN